MAQSSRLITSVREIYTYNSGKRLYMTHIAALLVFTITLCYTVHRQNMDFIIGPYFHGLSYFLRM